MFRVKSLIERPGGTRINLDGIEYHFKDTPIGQTCLMGHMPHVQRLAAIPEGFELVDMDATPGEGAVTVPAPALGIMKPPSPVDPMLGSSLAQSGINPADVMQQNAALDAEEQAARDAAAALARGSAAPMVAQVPLPQDADPVPADPVEPEQLPGQAFNDGLTPDMPREQLASIFEAELARTPHARAKPETIIAQIIQGRRERAVANTAAS